MDYTHLTQEQATALRHQRLAALEAEHWRTRLAAEELPGTPPDLAAALADLEGRIAHHREILGVAVPPEQVDQTNAETADTPGESDAAG